MTDFTVKEKKELKKVLESIFDLSEENELAPELTSIYFKLITNQEEV